MIQRYKTNAHEYSADVDSNSTRFVAFSTDLSTLVLASVYRFIDI